MIKLIKIELMKLFHKKTIYIVWTLIFVFCLFNNILYKIDYDKEGYYIKDYQKNNINELNKLERSLKKYNPQNKEDIEKYIDIKIKIDLIKLKKRYPKKSFQYNKVDFLKQDLYNINHYSYLEKNAIKLKESKDTYQEHLIQYDKNNWKYFSVKEKENIEKSIKEQTSLLANCQNKMQREVIQNQIKELKKELRILNIRLKNNIPYGINYLNDALISYKKNIDNMDLCNEEGSYFRKIECNRVKANLAIDKYVIENKVNIKQENNLNSLLRNIVEDYEIFIFIIVLLVSSTIISEEFNKGYIKLLLIKPYNRSKILLSKYLTIIIVLLVTILITIIFQMLIGGYLFGFESLKIRPILYNYNTNSIKDYSLLTYMVINTIYSLPKLIMILTICFAISVISTNSILSFSLTLLLYMFSNTINNIIIKSNKCLLNYIITLNWDYKYYLLSSYGPTKYLNNKIALIVYIIHLIILITISIIIFKKKNIKNI